MRRIASAIVAISFVLMLGNASAVGQSDGVPDSALSRNLVSSPAADSSLPLVPPAEVSADPQPGAAGVPAGLPEGPEKPCTNLCPYGYPSYFGIAGLTGSAASSANLEAKLFAELYGEVSPFPYQRPRFRLWGYGRIGSMEQTSLNSATAVSNLASANFTSLQSEEVVQSGEMKAGFGINLNSGNWNKKQPHLMFIAEIGAITPLNAQQTQSSTQAYVVTPAVQQFYSTGLFVNDSNAFKNPCYSSGTTVSTTGTAQNPTDCYISFYPEDRAQFFRNYGGGFRLSVPADQATNKFPLTIDATVGQDEFVRGGKLHGLVLNLGGVAPLSLYSAGLYVFGGMSVGIVGREDEPGPVLVPTTSSSTPAPTTSNTVIIALPQPNRDRWALGVGFDILWLIKNHTKSTAPAAP